MHRKITKFSFLLELCGVFIPVIVAIPTAALDVARCWSVVTARWISGGGKRSGLQLRLKPYRWSGIFTPCGLPALFSQTKGVVHDVASLIVSTATLLLSAVPAAISERLGLSLQGAMGVWFGTALLLILLGLG